MKFNISLKTGFLLIAIVFTAFINARAQEGSQSKHLISGVIGATFIPAAKNLGTSNINGLFVPIVGLEYFYKLNPKWDLGIMTNLELDKYYIVDEELFRENAIIVSLLGMYKLSDYWSLFTGGGVEIESHRSLAVFRFGTEYTIETKGNWVILPKLYFDFKANYPTWSFSIAFGRKL